VPAFPGSLAAALHARASFSWRSAWIILSSFFLVTACFCAASWAFPSSTCSTTYHKFHYYNKKNIVLLSKEPKEKKQTYLLIYSGLGLLHVTLSGGRAVGCHFLCILRGLHFRSFFLFCV
jgi:hypothetical protein